VGPVLTVLGDVLDVSMLIPHGACLLWRPELIWLNAVSCAALDEEAVPQRRGHCQTFSGSRKCPAIEPEPKPAS